MSKSRLLCIDFDGVLHLYDGKWGGEDAITGPAVEGAIGAVWSYMRAGFSIAVYSTRSRSEAGRRAMFDWLCNNGLTRVEYADIADPPLGYQLRGQQLQVRLPFTKPPAFLHLDDRNWPPWDGQFPTVEQLRQFQTWWEKGR